MNVRELVEKLYTLQEDLPIVVGIGNKAYEVLDVDELTVDYNTPLGNKLIFENKRGKVVFIGNIGNYDIENYEH